MAYIVLTDLKEYLGKTVTSFNLDTNAELNIFFENDLTISARVNTLVHRSYSASTDPQCMNNIEQAIIGNCVEAVTVLAIGHIVLSFSGGCELTLTPKDIYRISFP